MLFSNYSALLIILLIKYSIFSIILSKLLLEIKYPFLPSSITSLAPSAESKAIQGTLWLIASIKTIPKDYDGVMVAILKRGSNGKSYAKYKLRYDKYQELLKDYENTGKKSKELIEFEKDQFKVYSLFESINDKNLKYTRDDYIVFRMSEIEKTK